MEAPPPYDSVFATQGRSSSISVHSNDPMNTAVETQRAENAPIPSATGDRDAERRAARLEQQKRDGGCLNFGRNVNGMMNIGGGYNTGHTDGCMNIGGGKEFSKTDGWVS